MKKNFLKYLLFTLIITGGLSACKKDKVEAVAVTKENLTGTYTLLSLKAKVGATPETEIKSDVMEPCEEDDLYKLNADLSFLYVDAGTPCNPAGDYEDMWSVSGNTISFYGYQMEVKSFNGKTLIGTETYTEQGITYVLTATFQKQ